MTLTDHLDHLPDKKRRELARILQILFFEVEQFRATKLSGKKAAGKVLKVVLYGSYARGDWVEDRSSGYRSDYDLLIVVNTKSFAEEHELWEALEERLLQEQISHRIETPVIPIVHCLSDVNGQLGARPAILYRHRQRRHRALRGARPSAYPAEGADTRGGKGRGTAVFRQTVSRCVCTVSGRLKMLLPIRCQTSAAFDLHQATERFYHCVLLTLTLDSPKSHRIKVLRSQAESADARLVSAWPRDTRSARRSFELLSRAYVEARYSSNYTISNEELQWLVARVKDLQALVETICKERLGA